MERENEKYQYFESMLSEELSKPSIIEFHYLFEEKTYNRGAFLFQEGQPSTHLFFVKLGEVELYKIVKTDRKLEGPFLDEKKNRMMGKNARAIHPKPKPEFIGLVGPTQIIGEDDMLDGNLFHSYTAEAKHQPTQVYVIERHKFQNASNTLGKVYEQIKKMAECKKMHRLKQVNEVHQSNKRLRKITNKETKSGNENLINGFSKLGLSNLKKNLPPVTHNPVYVEYLEEENKKTEAMQEALKKVDIEMKRNDELLSQMIPKAVADKVKKGLNPVDTCEVYDLERLNKSSVYI